MGRTGNERENGGTRMAKRRRPKTYETTLDGKKTRVAIPENQRDEDTRLAALKDNLSPEAVAASRR